MDLNENIKKYRIKNHLTQKQLAEKAGVAEITIRQYEAKKREPKTEILIRLADIFGISIFDLRGEEPPAGYNDGKLTIEIDDKEMLVDPIEFQNTINNIVGKVHPTKTSSLLQSFNILNDKGQNKALEQVELLTKIPEYRKERPED